MNDVQYLFVDGEVIRVSRKYRVVVSAEEAVLEAANKGLSKVVMDLLDASPFNRVPIDLDATNDDNQTALHLAACQYGKWKPLDSHYYDIVKLLLERGASPNVQDSVGKTPIHYAAAHGSDNLLELLLDDRRVKIIRDWKGRTPLHCAVHERPKLYAVKLLIGVYMKHRKYRKLVECLLAAYGTQWGNYEFRGTWKEEFRKYLECFLLDAKRNAEVVSGHKDCGYCNGITETQQTTLAYPFLASRDEMSIGAYASRLTWALIAQKTIDELQGKCEKLQTCCNKPGLMSKATADESYW